MTIPRTGINSADILNRKSTTIIDIHTSEHYIVHVAQVALTRETQALTPFDKNKYPRLHKLTQLWASGTSGPTILTAIQNEVEKFEGDLRYGVVDLNRAKAIIGQRCSPFSLPVKRIFDNGAREPERQLEVSGGPAEPQLARSGKYLEGSISQGIVRVFGPKDTLVKGIINTPVTLPEALRIDSKTGEKLMYAAPIHNALKGFRPKLTSQERALVSCDPNIIGAIFLQHAEDDPIHRVFLEGIRPEQPE